MSFSTRTAMTSQASLALMKFLADLAKRLGVAEHVYVVGGAVRNFVIDQPVKDIDVIIDQMSTGKAQGKARNSEWFANQVAAAIPARTRIETNPHGVALLHIVSDWILGGENLRGEDVEIANARKESYAQSGAKPDVADATLEEDVYRRDFTFNTLMWRLMDLAEGPDKAEIIDLTGCGMKDLQERSMKCPKDPDTTFHDDPTRMLRAVKFIVKYGFKLPLDVRRSIEKNAYKLKNIKPSHLSNILINTFLKEPTGRKALMEMQKLGLLDVLKEIVQKDKAFRNALAGWADREAKVTFLFDLMDFGLPAGKRLSFLDRYQVERVQEITVGLSADAANQYVLVLQQPGKAVDTRALMEEFGLKGRDVKRISDLARVHLLSDPALATDARRLTQRVREDLLGGKMASMVDKQAAVKGDGSSGVGLFLRLPKALGKQFPDLGDEDDSPAHCTFLYVGNVKGRETEFLEAVGFEVAANTRGPVQAVLQPLDYFIHPAMGRRVAISRVRFSLDMGQLRDRIRQRLLDLKFEVQDGFPLVYQPHVTLQYMDDMDGKYEGQVPVGSWMVNEIEVWGLPKVHTIPLGRTAKKFELNVGDPLLMGKYLNSPGRIESFGQNDKGDPTVKVRKTPKGDKGTGAKKEVKVFKIRYDADQAKKDKESKEALVSRLACARLVVRCLQAGAHTLVLTTGGTDITKRVPSDALPLGALRQASITRLADRFLREGALFDRTNPETMAWVKGFFSRHSKLRRYSGIPVVRVDEPNRRRHPEASYTTKGIELYPNFRQLSSGLKDFVFAHEIGHAVLERWGGRNFMAAAESLGLDPWDTPNLPFGQNNFDEAFSDCFASYHTDGDVLRRYPLWAKVVDVALAEVKTAAGKFKDKKTIKNQKGEDQVVYEYSEGQIANRHREKAKKIEGLRKNIRGLRSQIKTDLKSSDETTRLNALAVGLMNDTYERVGNAGSAKEGHFGVTGWQAQHVTFSGGKATISYVGKSGVTQKKVTSDSALVSGLKAALKGKSGTDSVFAGEDGTVDAGTVNAYLKPHGITAKDIRGLHANREMQERLKAVRSSGGKLPTDKKKREEKLKAEFKKALEETASEVGHEASTLRSQYLVPGLEDDFMRDGTVKKKLDKKGSSIPALAVKLQKIVNRFRGDVMDEWWEDRAETRATFHVEFSREADVVSAYNALTAAGVSVDLDDWHLDIYAKGRQIRRTARQDQAVRTLTARWFAEGMSRQAIIGLNNATDGDEGDIELRGFEGLTSSLTYYETAIVQDMSIHEVSIQKDAGGYSLRGHRLNSDAVTELVGAGYLEEQGTEVGFSGLFDAKKQLYTASGPKTAIHRGLLITLLRFAEEPTAVFAWGESEVAKGKDPDSYLPGGVIGYVWRRGEQWYSMVPEAMVPTKERSQQVAVRHLRQGGRTATKDEGEKEREEVERLQRRNPPKKPPRKDLRRNRMKPDDDDVGGSGADGDKDLSLNYKKVARLAERYCRHLIAKAAPSQPKHKPGGPPWQSDDGKWVAKNKDGNTQTFGDDDVGKMQAEAFVSGKEVSEEDAKADADKKKQQERAQAKKQEQEQVRALASSILTTQDLPDEIKAQVEAAIQKADSSLMASYKQHQTALLEDMEGGISAAMMKDARRDPFKGIDTSDPDQVAEALAKAVVRDRLLMDPSNVGGKPLSSEPLSEEDRQGRAETAMKQFRHLKADQRKQVGEKAAAQLAELEPDSPEASELNAIIDGLQAAAALNDEPLEVLGKEGKEGKDGKNGKLLREPLSPKLGMLLKEMVRQGNAKTLFLSDPTKIYEAEGREAVRDAMGQLDDATLTEMSKDTPWSAMGDLLGNPDIDPDVQEYLRSFMLDMGVNSMTTVQGVAASMARKKADPTTSAGVYDDIATDLASASTEDIKSVVDAVLSECMADAGTTVAECLEKASERLQRAQFKATVDAAEKMDPPPTPGDVPFAIATAIAEGADPSIANEQWEAEKPLEERKREMLENLQDPKDRERVQEMSPEDFKAFERSVLSDDEDMAA